MELKFPVLMLLCQSPNEITWIVLIVFFLLIVICVILTIIVKFKVNNFFWKYLLTLSYSYIHIEILHSATSPTNRREQITRKSSFKLSKVMIFALSTFSYPSCFGNRMIENKYVWKIQTGNSKNKPTKMDFRNDSMEFDYYISWKMSLKIPKRQSVFVYRRTDNTMTKRKSTKGQTTIYKTYIYN